MMLKSFSVTAQEAHILNVAGRIKFGEIYKAETHCRERVEQKELTEAQERFIEMLREEGWICIGKIVVHNGEPATVEIDGEDGGLEYKIKRKV
jgi:hypothetical protein